MLTLQGHLSTVVGVAFSADGNRLVSVDLGVVRVWNAGADAGPAKPPASPGH